MLSFLVLKFRTYHDITKMFPIEVMYYVIGCDISYISWLLSFVSLTILMTKILVPFCKLIMFEELK